MKNLKTLSKRGLALFISLVMCLSLLPGTALAAEGSGTKEDPYVVLMWDDENVDDALNASGILGTSDEWYYNASLKAEKLNFNWEQLKKMFSDPSISKTRPQENKWVSISGENAGQYITGSLLPLSLAAYVCTYPALSPVPGVTYEVSTSEDGINHIDVTFDIRTKSGPEFTQKDPVGTVKLAYNEDLTIDVATTTENILAAVVEISDPILTKDNVVIEYEAKGKDVATGLVPHTDWAALNGEKKGIYTYPAISEGTWNIRITVKAAGYSEESFVIENVPFKAREDSNVVIQDCGPVVYNSDTGVLKQYVFNNAIVWDASELPAGASAGDFTYQYKANLALIEDLNLGSFDLGSIIGKDSNLDLGEFFQESWVPFEGASVKDVIEGAITDKIPGGAIGDWIGGAIGGGVSSAADKILAKIAEALAEKMGISVEEAQELLARYPAIGAGEQTIRIAYNGNPEYAPSAYSNEAVLTITKAPAKVTVNSTTIPVKEVQPGLPGFITTEPANAGTVTVYAGLNQNAKPVVYIDLSQADSVFKYLPKLLGLEDGTNVAELYKKLTDGELSKWLEKAGIGSDITGKLIDAIAGVINNDTISGIISGNKDNIAGLINKGLGSVGSAIEQMGDVTVYFRAPQEAGLYGVASFVSDKNYEANPNIAVGYLVITMDAIKVTVNSTSVNVGDALPEDFITTDPHTDKVCTIYAGLPMGVWLDVPGAYQFAGVTNVGELQAALNAQASVGTDAVGLDYNLVNKLLEVITRLDMPGVIDNVPVHYGVPTDTAGVYTVTAIASNNGADIPGVGVGTLKVGLNQGVAVTVANKTIYVGDAIPEDLVVTTPEDARTLVLYAGVDAGSGKLDGVVYLDGLSGAPETITIGALRQRIAGNPMLEDYRIISAILENLPETAADNWTVKTGKPPVQAGAYTVVAGAVKSGSVPAIDVGTLTIIDKEMSMIIYVAADGNGAVRLNNQENGGAVVFEMVPSTVQETVGATAIVKDTDNYHFAKWTKVELLGESPYSGEASIQPARPASLLGHLPAWLVKLIPGIGGMPDLSKVAAIYVAHFERHVWDEGEATTAPTCTEDGVMTYHCTKPGCTGSKTEPIDALGHDWGEWEQVNDSDHTRTCKRNSTHMETAAHTWDDGVVTAEPTCTANGVKTFTCSGCDAVKTESVDMVPHAYGEWDTTTYPSTCKTTGEKFRTCSVCGDIDSEELPIDPTNHQKVFDVPAKAPTCTETGLTAGTRCEACNVALTAQDIVPSLGGHKWVDNELDAEETLPGCEDALVIHQHCANAGCTAARLLAVSPLGHVPADEEYVAPTCTAAGHVGGTYCTRCNAVIEEQEIIDALGHDYKASDTPPTCTESGFTRHICSRCGDAYDDELINSSGHTIAIDEAVPATCDAAGLTEGFHCSVCGEVFVEQTTASALGHIWDNGTVTTPATETTVGVRTFTCTRNPDHTRTEEIPMLDHTHSYAAAVTAPTCTEQGYTTYTCSCGSSYIGSYVSPTGHSWDAGVITVYPTYTSTGVRTYTCTACGAVRTDPIPALTNTIPTPNYPSYPSTPSNPTPTPTPTVNIPENSTPLGGSPDSLVDIGDDNVPLAMLPGLNTLDHIAYIQGYSDGTVRPMNKITRAEVATIFYRLMTDAYRAANYTTSHSFTDAPANQWYNEAIATAARAGLLKGYGDGSVRPNKNITRAEFVTIAANFLDGSGSGTTAFSDVRGHWAEADINRAVEAGWIKGDGNGNFRPDDSITRAEAVTIINRILNRATDTAEMLDSMVTWPDSRESDWWYVAVQEATNGHDYESSLPYERWTTLF